MTEVKVRIDKWLWAARFFKTRSMAAQAVAGGKVHLNNARIKPARAVQPGDELRIRRGEIEFIVIVQAISDKRRPAKEAGLLYEETETSVQQREAVREEKRLEAANRMYGPMKRPDKRARRQIRSFTRKD
ncbi:MAG: RNA-binding protein [Deltaproteobacteria bacterium]|jgi:ribosome-associated heat shock protein Hsp15|nr:RNA-binding protein [Deltaproteobacteria bacterium]MBW2521110.1 RNA-binding protein [Deltaproteobacteria bacterium]